jgi:glycosyltransferase involved in cell wall biosynthesis
MKVSVCITVFNEVGSVAKLLESLLHQSKKPDEIVIVDGGSTDKTVEIIHHFQKKDRRIRLLVQKSSPAEGRNLSVELAKNNIIAMTDAGCVIDKNWLKRIAEPFKNREVGIVAGFYKMTGDTVFQKAESAFLGVLPDDFDATFLPSARSIAFRKEIWMKVGGFPENKFATAEDTLFNYKAVEENVKFARVKNALVEWETPGSVAEFFNKIRNYAKGDAGSKVFRFPTKNLASHNIKALLIFARYLAGLLLFVFSFKTPLLAYVLILFLFLYIFWAFRKVYIKFNDVKVGLWGIALQIISDFGVMLGFVEGISGVADFKKS